MKVLNEYPGSHHYWENWERDEKMYCPTCGSKGMLWTADGGDYYAGPESICTGCLNRFHLQGGGSIVTDANDIGRYEQLRSGVTKEPTTKRGG